MLIEGFTTPVQCLALIVGKLPATLFNGALAVVFASCQEESQTISILPLSFLKNNESPPAQAGGLSLFLIRLSGHTAWYRGWFCTLYLSGC